MKLGLESTVPQYRDAIFRFIKFKRVSIAEGLRIQGRELGKQLIALTPPRTKKQGTERVRKDIAKVILGLEDIEDRKPTTVEGHEVVRAFVTKSGVLYGVDKKLYRPDAIFADLSEHHQRARISRGRVTNAGEETRDIGRWKFVNLMVAPADIVQDYIAAVQDRVGRGKGGWASGVIELGGKVAAWIAMHARTAGHFEDHTDEISPYLLFENQSEWASGGDQDRVVVNAIKARTRAISNFLAIKEREALRKAKLQ